MNPTTIAAFNDEMEKIAVADSTLGRAFAERNLRSLQAGGVKVKGGWERFAPGNLMRAADAQKKLQGSKLGKLYDSRMSKAIGSRGAVAAGDITRGMGDVIQKKTGDKMLAKVMQQGGAAARMASPFMK